jgi:hypothetical protein
MPIPATNLVKKLITQLNHFIKLSITFGSEFQIPGLKFSVSLSYSQLRFNVYKDKDLYFQYTFYKEESSSTTPPDCYFDNSTKTEALKKHFEPLLADSTTHAVSGKIEYTETLNEYLTTAESIASEAYLCAAGDDYRPGYFSEIMVDEQGVTLEQINHMNAKSLSHKQNYSLRDLQFFIPFIQATEQKVIRFEEDYIGIMRIHFSDRSSENNKLYGDKIREKIKAHPLLIRHSRR